MSDENEVETMGQVHCVECGTRVNDVDASPCARCLDWICVACIDDLGVVCATCIEEDGE